MSNTDEYPAINEELIYRFHFDTREKVVHLTKQELLFIRYLFALVTNENTSNEHVFHNAITYKWLKPILHSIKTGKPYDLFKNYQNMRIFSMFLVCSIIFV